MKRVRHNAEETLRDRYDFCISAGNCSGPPAVDLSQLRLVAIKVSNGRKVGQTRVDTARSAHQGLSSGPPSSAPPSPSALSLGPAPPAHQHQHQPMVFRTHLLRALYVSAATMHERKLVQLVLQGKEERGLSAVFESWRALASWELDLALFTRADGPSSTSLDLEASALGPQPTRLAVTIFSCPTSQAAKDIRQAAAAAGVPPSLALSPAGPSTSSTPSTPQVADLRPSGPPPWLTPPPASPPTYSPQDQTYIDTSHHARQQLTSRAAEAAATSPGSAPTPPPHPATVQGSGPEELGRKPGPAGGDWLSGRSAEGLAALQGLVASERGAPVVPPSGG
ncbi:hypothetical protein V8C86DRAFT_3023174, partial [Haematococcus lacustris]